MGLVKVATTEELKDGQGKVVQANGKTLALFRQGGHFFAMDNTCLHRGGPLGEGELSGEVVTCPWHGWQYNIKTGVSPVSPAVKVQTFPVKVEGQDVFVQV